MSSVSELSHKHQSPRGADAVPGEPATLPRFPGLIARNSKFRDMWCHKGACRSCLDVLAQCAVADGWPEPEIEALLTAHRSENKQVRQDSAVAKLEELIAPKARQRGEDGEISSEDTAKDDPAWKAAITEQLSNVLGLIGEHKIIGIKRYLSEPREYAIETASGCIRLGDVRNLIGADKLQAKIAELAGRMIPTFKRNSEWAKIQQALLDACVDVAVGDEGTNAGLANSWLTAYLAARPVLDSFKEQEGQMPFSQDSRIYLFLSDFRRWIYKNHGDRVPSKELCILMRRGGAEPANLNVKRDSKRTSVRVWRVPQQTGPEVHTVGTL
jgi:hypothetical protein